MAGNTTGVSPLSQVNPRTWARRSYAITLNRTARFSFRVSLRCRLMAPAWATHLMSICRSYVTIKYVELAMMPRDFGMIGKASAPSPRPGHSALEQVNCRRGCRPSGCAPLSGHRPGLMDCERGSPAPSWQLPTLLSACWRRLAWVAASPLPPGQDIGIVLMDCRRGARPRWRARAAGSSWASANGRSMLTIIMIHDHRDGRMRRSIGRLCDTDSELSHSAGDAILNLKYATLRWIILDLPPGGTGTY